MDDSRIVLLVVVALLLLALLALLLRRLRIAQRRLRERESQLQACQHRLEVNHRYLDSLAGAAHAVMGRWTQRIGVASAQTEESVTTLTNEFGDIIAAVTSIAELTAAQGGEKKAAALALRTQCAALEARVAAILVALQFQDRVKQILAHARDDIDRFAEQLAAQADQPEPRPLDLQAWLADMDAKFAGLNQQESGAAADGEETSGVSFFQ